jgi:malonyl-CoA O-methyltransferase
LSVDRSGTDVEFDVLPTREGYDRWSAIYDVEDNPLIALEGPKVVDLLGEVRGLRVADIGCGTGRHAIPAAERGAQVIGVDYSDGMLLQALAKRGARAVRFIAADITWRLPLQNESFDRVVCCLAAEHIADLPRFFSELGRICRHDGFVIVSDMHPGLLLRGQMAQFRDPDTGRRTRPLSYPYQISDYVMAVIESGCEIDHMSEHIVDEPLVARSEGARRYLGWPMLFLMRLRPGTSRIFDEQRRPMM